MFPLTIENHAPPGFSLSSLCATDVTIHWVDTSIMNANYAGFSVNIWTVSDYFGLYIGRGGDYRLAKPSTAVKALRKDAGHGPAWQIILINYALQLERPCRHRR